MRRLLALLAFLAFVAGAARADLLSALGLRSGLVELLLEQISDPGSFEVTADEVLEPSDSFTELRGVKVSDGAGVWITIDRATLQWTPEALSLGAVVITRLEIEGLTVLRPPSEDAEAPELKESGTTRGLFDWPRAPLTVVVAGVKLTDIAVAEGVLPQPIRFDATGFAQDQGDVQEIRLELTRTDAVAGAIALRLRRDFAAATLALSVTADEAAGGMVAAAAGFPPDAPATLRLEADGPATDWRLDFAASVERVFAAEGRATLAYGTPFALDTEFTLTAGPALGPEAATLIGSGAMLRARLSETRPGIFTVTEGRIASPSLRGTATGQLGLGAGVSDLAVSLEADGALSALLPEGSRFARAAFEGTVFGPRWALGAAGALEVTGLATPRLDAARLALDTRVTRTGQAIGFALAGSGAGLRLDRIGPEVIGPAKLAVEGRYDSGRLDLAAVSLASAGITLDASGHYDSAAGSGALRAALAAPDIAPLAAAYGAAAAGRVEGSLDAVLAGAEARAEARIALEDLRSDAADAARLALAGRVTSDATGLGFEITGGAEALRLDRLTPDILGETALAATGRLAGEVLTLQAASLRSAGIELAASGLHDLGGGLTRLTASLRTPDFAPIAAAYGERVTGRVAADVTFERRGTALAGDGRVTLTGFTSAPADAGDLTLEGRLAQDAGGVLAFDLAGSADALRLDRLPPALVGAASLAAEGTLDGTRLTLAAAALRAGGLALEASGSHDLAPGGALDLGYRLAGDLGPLAGAYGIDAAGTLRAEGRATGTAAAPRLAGDLAVDGARHGARGFGTVTLGHDVALGAAPSGSLRLAATEGPAGAAALDADFRTEGADLVLDRLDARAAGLRATGRGALALATGLAEATLDLAAADLRPLGRLAGTPLAGRAEGRLTLSRDGGAQGARLALALADLAAGDLRAGRADIAARAGDLLGTPRLDLTADLAALSAGGAALDTARLTATGPLAALETRLEAAGTRDGAPLTLAAAGRVSAGGAATTLRLAELEAALGEDRLRLDAPATLRLGGGSIELTGLDLALPEGGRLSGDAAMRGAGYAGDLTLTRLSLPALSRIAGLPFSAGTVDARATFDTRRGTLDATLAGRGIVHEATRRATGGLDIDLGATWAARRLEASGTVSGSFGAPVRLRLAAPLVPGPGGMPRLAPGGALDGAIDWAGNIGDLWTLVPLRGHVLDGEAAVALRLAGSLDAPLLGGEVRLREGTYQNLDLGTILTGVTLGTVLREDGGLGLDLAASDGAKGTLRARADLTETPEGTALDLALDIASAVLVRRDDVAAQISGAVAVRGPLTALAVTGALTVDTAEVRLVNAAPPSVVDLDGIRLLGAPEPPDAAGGGSTVDLDLTVTAPGRIFVRGRGLESEWRMDLAITGEAGSPRVAGAIERLRGTLDFLGAQFDLATGRVAFDGGPRIAPRIDVALEAEANGIVGRILVEGPATDPDLRFASTPSLPEDEVLPRVLFGRSKQSLTGEQALQLAAGIATLLSGSRGPLDIARDTLGVDTLRVDGIGSTSASVTVGQNLGNGVFVGARQGLSGEPGAVTVEVEVFDGVTLDAEAGQDGTTSVGITLRRDF